MRDETYTAEQVAAAMNAAARDNGGKQKQHDIKVGNPNVLSDPKRGYKHAGEFFRDVVQASGEAKVMSERLNIVQKATLSTFGSEGVGVDGGFAVPPEFRSDIAQRVLGEDSILSRTDQIPLSTNAITFPDDETTPWQTSGGILASWEGEATTIPQTKPQLKQKELRLRKLSCLVPVTARAVCSGQGARGGGCPQET